MSSAHSTVLRTVEVTVDAVLGAIRRLRKVGFAGCSHSANRGSCRTGAAVKFPLVPEACRLAIQLRATKLRNTPLTGEPVRAGSGAFPTTEVYGMKFEKTVRIGAPPAEIWGLMDDIEAVALCIPGISNYKATGPKAFSALLTQRVGPVTARFKLTTKLTDLDPLKSVTAVVDGTDTGLGSSVHSEQVFAFTEADDGAATEIAITADVRMVGRVATFGQRIVGIKAEQVVIGSLANVSRLLEERRAGSS